MNEKLYYNTIDKESVAEFKDKGSRFLACAYPVRKAEDFKGYMQLLKKEHARAEHHCFAYRIGADVSDYRLSDDGEPAGTAGKPILGQIDSRELTDVAVIVVRYFGGTLLGVPGLINAYKSASAMALQLTPVIRKPVTVGYRLSFDYTRMNEVMQIVKRLQCIVIKSEAQLFCSMQIAVPREFEEQCIYRFKELQAVEVIKTNK